MKFVCDKNDLLDAIIPAMYGVATRASIPLLEGLKISCEGENISVCGYDLEKGVKAHFKAHKIWENGSAVFDAAQFSSIVKGLPDGEVVITIDPKGVANVISFRTNIDIHTRSDETYPALPRLSGNKNFVINQGEFKKMINQVLFAVGNNEQKPVLKGVFFKIENGILHLSALDGFKLAYREYDLRKMEDVQIPQEDITFIVPGKSLTELLKLLTNDNETVNLELTDKHIIVNFENVSFFSRLIDGEFIDYNRFIPKDNKTVITVETSKLIKSAERASLIINEKAKTPVKFNFNENGINVNCATVTGRIFDEVEAEFEGVGVELAFNVKYVLDTLRACPEKVRISLSTPHSAMLITPADEENKFVYLVLPVSIKN